MKEKFNSEQYELGENIDNWLADLNCLYEVPVQYIIPDKRLLPIESIRFFYVDPLWTDALCDGAVSIGRVNTLEKSADLNLLPQRIFSAKTMLKSRRERKIKENNIRAGSSINSGFILHSKLVSGWKGLEVKGFNEEVELQIRRSQRIGNEILLVIFDGEIDRVELYEPPEQLHFGTDGDDRAIKIRRISEGNEGKPSDKEIKIPVEENGRIKLKETENLIKEQLRAIGEPDNITSAEFALEMLYTAGQCVFTRQ